jgi:ribose/xylose/arabinose/galactoside ABC-type transport system permease subunit
MFLVASSNATISLPSMLLIAAFSALMLVRGIQHYRGRNTWIIKWLPWSDGFFGGAWFGAFGLMVVLCLLAGRVSAVLEAVLAIPTFLLFLIALVSMVWLPSRLLPGWYRHRHR